MHADSSWLQGCNPSSGSGLPDKRLVGIAGGAQKIATDLLFGGVLNRVGELVERVAHLRRGNIGGCVLKSL
jgi:hypothetical protein